MAATTQRFWGKKRRENCSYLIYYCTDYDKHGMIRKLMTSSNYVGLNAICPDSSFNIPTIAFQRHLS